MGRNRIGILVTAALLLAGCAALLAPRMRTPSPAPSGDSHHRTEPATPPPAPAPPAAVEPGEAEEEPPPPADRIGAHAWRVSGVVVDESGAPVAGAAMDVWRIRDDAAPETGTAVFNQHIWSPSVIVKPSSESADENEPLIEEVDTEAGVVARSDGAGRFEVEVEPFGGGDAWVLRARKGDLVEGSVIGRSDAAGVRIVLRKAFAIEGRVVDARSGKPVAGARVEADPVPEPPRDAGWAVGRDAEGESAEDGSFRLEGLVRGTYRVYGGGVHDDEPFGPVASTRVVDLRADEAGIVLDQGLSIEGIAIDPAGQPLPAKRLFASAEYVGRSPDGWGAGNWVPLGDDGRFLLYGLRPGPHVVRVEERCRGTATESFAVTEVPAEAGAKDLRVTLARGKRISGRVLPPEGASLGDRDVRVMVEPARGPAFLPWTPSEVHASRYGSFATRALDPGVAFDLAVRVHGVGVAELRGVLPGAADVVLRLEPPLSISGRLLGPGDAPVAGAVVVALPQGGRRMVPSTPTGPDGSFRIPMLSPGSYFLFAEPADRDLAPVDPEAAVAAGAEGVVVRAARAHEFTARLLLPGNAASDSREVSVTAEVVTPGRTRLVGADFGPDGVLRIRGLPPCRIRLRLRSRREPPDLSVPLREPIWGPFEVPGSEPTIRPGG